MSAFTTFTSIQPLPKEKKRVTTAPLVYRVGSEDSDELITVPAGYEFDGAVPTPPNNTTTFLRGDGTFATPTASATITTQDEGSNLSTTVTTLNFTGAGVTASGAGATTTINIPGGGGGSSTPYEMSRQTRYLPL